MSLIHDAAMLVPKGFYVIFSHPHRSDQLLLVNYDGWAIHVRHDRSALPGKRHSRWAFYYPHPQLHHFAVLNMNPSFDRDAVEQLLTQLPVCTKYAIAEPGVPCAA